MKRLLPSTVLCFSAWFTFLYVVVFAHSLAAAPMSLIGPHPTSPLTFYPNIHSIKSYNGRVYFGYGDYNYYPVNVVSSYAESDNTFRMEHSASTDAVDTMRVIGNQLFVPSVDPIHYDDFADFCYYTPGLGWRNMAPAGAYHIFDLAQLGTDLFIAGSRDISEGSGTGGAALLRSTDAGRSWSVITVPSTSSRYYWCFTMGTKLWVQGGYYEAGGFTVSAALTPTYFYKPTVLPGGFAVALSGRSPTGSGTAYSLVSFDGTTQRTLLTGVLDFSWDGTGLYALTSTGVFIASNLTVSGATWTLTSATPPASPRALEVLNGIAYVASGGNIYAGRLSGAVWGLGSPAVVNELPDAFGRGLAFDGSRLVVGAPDFSTSTIPLAGQATVWDVPLPTSGNWQQAATISPAVPDFSGWFGKGTTVRGDLMAVVEGGNDSTNRDRGSSALVHTFQLVNGSWVARTVLNIPFAHSALLDENMLLVGTGNPAANQAAGLPGVNPYLITRDAQTVPIFTAQTQLVPISANYGYKPIARVVRAEDRLIVGFAGDPSRNGGRGLVSVWKKAANGLSWITAPVQEFTAVNGTDRYDRFGYAVAAEGTLLAVGAPRDDTLAKQAGRVYLYQWNGTAYAQTHTVSPAVAQSELALGTSLAMKGGKLLVGAPGLTVANVPHRGSVSLYRHTGTTWVFDRTIKRPSGSLAEFGIEVAIGDTWLAAGSRYSSPGPLTSRVALESVYSASDWFAANGLSGASASLSADVDFDGITNLVEFASGLPPGVSDVRTYTPGASSGLPLITPDSAATDGSMLITYLRPAADSLLVATVEAGTSPATLAVATVEPVQTNTLSGMIITTVRVRPPASTTTFFARVRYSYP